MKTTLNQIREFSPCQPSWVKLLKSLNKTKADDEPLPILHILDSNGFDDAIWCLRTVKNEERKIRLFMVFCARKVQHLMEPVSIHALNVSERFANGLASEEEFEDALNKAWTAARIAVYAARIAEYAEIAGAVKAVKAAMAAGAAWAAWAAASGDARVVGLAVWHSGYARDSRYAMAAAGDASRAAWVSAWAAAGYAEVARDIRSAEDARYAAREEQEPEQEKELRRICIESAL